jgi:hypothetical protein
MTRMLRDTACAFIFQEYLICRQESSAILMPTLLHLVPLYVTFWLSREFTSVEISPSVDLRLLGETAPWNPHPCRSSRIP